MISSSDQLRSWLHLANLPLAARTANLLLAHFSGDPAAVIAASDAELDEVPGLQERSRLRLRDSDAAPTDKQIAWIEEYDVKILVRGDKDYPAPLNDIFDPPPILFVRGELTEQDCEGIAMVGSRKATPYGVAVADKFARELAGHGVTVVSGGARGIDTAAHAGALKAGGRTIAVLGCGLDIDYPKPNHNLFESIAGHGALMTEYPPGAQPESWRFPMRNRIISGLSVGVVVVEAPARSGSLITATCAADQGRTVMAIPANIDREFSVGSNQLIKDGAIMVTSPQDVLEAVGLVQIQASLPAQPQLDLMGEVAPAKPLPDLPEPRRTLLAALSRTPQHMDTIARAAGITASQAGVEMTLLELSGLACRLPGNNYIRAL
jgi:DNA processing protein